MLEDKKIVLAISGSIAAYKSVFLCRLLIKAGCKVKVVMTKASESFITPLTLSTLSGHSVSNDWEEGAIWNNHVDLGLWADLVLIAPATANTISKMAHGLCDNMLMATYLSAKCPVMICPAMDLDMWKHPSTQSNIQLLQSYGNMIVPVGHGFLASGLVGDGRMAEPEEILEFVHQHFMQYQVFKGQKILITAGPTYEAIDPVRFIGNYSSGKMGFAIAKLAASLGADVILISGPTKLEVNHDRIQLFKVTSAQEMYEAANDHFDNCDIAILAAAVADYKPATIAPNKIKKNDQHITIDLVKTIDIAASLGEKKGNNQILVGFALETNDEINHAKQKLHKKNLDFIVLNSLQDIGAGFMHDTNKVSILDSTGNIVHYGLKSKEAVAGDILDYLVNFIK